VLGCPAKLPEDGAIGAEKCRRRNNKGIKIIIQCMLLVNLTDVTFCLSA
jgi:hypothetical protein